MAFVVNWCYENKLNCLVFKGTIQTVGINGSELCGKKIAIVKIFTKKNGLSNNVTFILHNRKERKNLVGGENVENETP